MQKSENKLPKATRSRRALRYAGITVIAVGGLATMTAMISSNADTSADIHAGNKSHSCAYDETSLQASNNRWQDSTITASISDVNVPGSKQVTIPAATGTGWLSIDAFEISNAQFQQFVKATGYKTIAEKPWSGVDAATGTPLSSPPGSAVFRQPTGVADAAFRQWWEFVDGANWRHPTGTDSNIENKGHYPVVQLALEDAEAYAEWAGRRLLTAAEWEHAARYAEDENRRVWHKDESQPTSEPSHWLANTWQGIFPLRDSASDGFKGMAPIGCYQPLASGLHDMIGNVWEWVQPQGDEQISRRLPVIAASVSDQTPLELSNRGASDQAAGAPQGNFHGEVNSPNSSRIMGGSYLCSASFCMNYHPGAYFYQDATLGTNHIGFRTVADIPAPEKS